MAFIDSIEPRSTCYHTLAIYHWQIVALINSDVSTGNTYLQCIGRDRRASIILWQVFTSLGVPSRRPVYVRNHHNYCRAGHQSGVSISETRGYIPSEFRGTNAWQPILTIASEQTNCFLQLKWNAVAILTLSLLRYLSFSYFTLLPANEKLIHCFRYWVVRKVCSETEERKSLYDVSVLASWLLFWKFYNSFGDKFFQRISDFLKINDN